MFNIRFTFQKRNQSWYIAIDLFFLHGFLSVSFLLRTEKNFTVFSLSHEIRMILLIWWMNYVDERHISTVCQHYSMKCCECKWINQFYQNVWSFFNELQLNVDTDFFLNFLAKKPFATCIYFNQIHSIIISGTYIRQFVDWIKHSELCAD